MGPCSGTHINDMIGSQHGVFIMFHHDQGVSQVTHLFQGSDQLGVVPLVQPDARLIQDIEHSHQLGTDLGGQTDPLRLPAGQGTGGTVQCEIVQTHIDQETEAA